MTISFTNAQWWQDTNNLGATYTMNTTSATTSEENTSNFSGTPTPSTPATVPAGSFAALTYYTSDTTSPGSSISSVTDSGSNSWTAPAGLFHYDSAAGGLGIAYSNIATALTASTGTVKPTYNTTNFVYLMLNLLAFSGVATSSPQDGTIQTMAAQFTNAYALGTGGNASLSYSANDLVIGLFCQYATDHLAFTPTAGYSLISTRHSNGRQLDVVYGMPASSGSITTFATVGSGNANIFGMAAAFSAGSSGPQPGGGHVGNEMHWLKTWPQAMWRSAYR